MTTPLLWKQIPHGHEGEEPSEGSNSSCNLTLQREGEREGAEERGGGRESVLEEGKGEEGERVQEGEKGNGRSYCRRGTGTSGLL